MSAMKKKLEEEVMEQEIDELITMLCFGFGFGPGVLLFTEFVDYPYHFFSFLFRVGY